MSQWDVSRPPGHDDPYGVDEETDPYPVTWERDPGRPAGPASPDAFPWLDEDWPPRRPRRRGWRGRGPGGPGGPGEPGGGRRRWLVLALVAVAAVSVGAALALTGSSGGRPNAAGSAPPLPTVPPALSTPSSTGQAGPGGPGSLTTAQASQVLAGYTAANNAANAQRSDAVLATIETGSSYAVDAGLYRVQQAENAAPYPAFGPRRTRFYIPRETAYPRWFVAQVSNADLAAPAKVTGTEYLLFTQAGPGAPWKNAVEPYLLAGAAAPAVALGADGLATPVTAASPLAVPARQLAQVTASSLDGAGQLPNPGNLADLQDRAFWQRKLPASSVTDAHTPSGPVYGLSTAGGGALLFYADAAELTLTAPAGEAMHLTVPGFYSPGQALSRAGLGYLEQFATYDPPPGGSGPRVVADYSGLTSGT